MAFITMDDLITIQQFDVSELVLEYQAHSASSIDSKYNSILQYNMYMSYIFELSHFSN